MTLGAAQGLPRPDARRRVRPRRAQPQDRAAHADATRVDVRAGQGNRSIEIVLLGAGAGVSGRAGGASRRAPRPLPLPGVAAPPEVTPATLPQAERRFVIVLQSSDRPERRIDDADPAQPAELRRVHQRTHGRWRAALRDPARPLHQPHTGRGGAAPADRFSAGRDRGHRGDRSARRRRGRGRTRAAPASSAQRRCRVAVPTPSPCAVADARARRRHRPTAACDRRSHRHRCRLRPKSTPSRTPCSRQRRRRWRSRTSSPRRPLNELLNLPPNRNTRAAQELAGVARARTGDMARARIEFETYLQLYPQGEGSDRVRRELAALPAAAAPTAQGEAKPAVETTATGSASMSYFGGNGQMRSQDFKDSPIAGLPQVAGDPLFSADKSQPVVQRRRPQLAPPRRRQRHALRVPRLLHHRPGAQRQEQEPAVVAVRRLQVADRRLRRAPGPPIADRRRRDGPLRRRLGQRTCCAPS